jgi:tetratricopeptide (TPR) repeat protein
MKSVVQRWVDWSAAVTRDEFSAIPLIDSWLGRDLEEELHRAWRDGDSELHAGFVSALLESPSDLAVRFAVLNAYYHLMEHKRPLEEEDVLGGLAKQREAFRRKLSSFVGFQPVESCADLRTIRWEIVNSCAAEDYDRAFRLCDRLEPLLPGWQVSFARGRLRFLVVHLPLWDELPSLYSWDLPIGPAPTDSINRMQANVVTVARCLSSPELATGIPDDARAHLRRAIAEFETASDGNPDIALDCHLMLARSYAAVGQNHEAARCYRGVLAHRDALLRYFKEAFELLPQERMRDLLSELFHRLVTAHQRAEETDEAIKAAQEWLDEFPAARDAYPIMARLYWEKNDLKAACSWYRKGEERIPELGNDWNISLILMLGETASPASIDRAVDAYIDEHPDKMRLISFALARHWSAFRRLDQPSKDRWSAGILLLNDKPFGEVSLGNAVHDFAVVVERALRESIFIPFKEEYKRNPGLLGDISQPAEKARIFCQFLICKSDTSDPGLGQMLTIAKIAKKSAGSRQTPWDPFAGWLKSNYPSYFTRIGQLGEERMFDSRNREDHGKTQLITQADADKMFDASKEVLSLIHEDRAQQSLG